MLARSAGFSSEYVATSCSADCASPGDCCSRTSCQSAKVVGPFANGEPEVLGLRRKSWPMSHMPSRSRSIATSSITASPEPSVK